MKNEKIFKIFIDKTYYYTLIRKSKTTLMSKMMKSIQLIVFASLKNVFCLARRNVLQFFTFPCTWISSISNLRGKQIFPYIFPEFRSPISCTPSERKTRRRTVSNVFAQYDILFNRLRPFFCSSLFFPLANETRTTEFVCMNIIVRHICFI